MSFWHLIDTTSSEVSSNMKSCEISEVVFDFYHFVDFVVASEGLSGFETVEVALLDERDRVAVETELGDGGTIDACGGACDHQLVARTQGLGSLELGFGYRDTVEVVGYYTEIDFVLRGLRAVAFGPLAETAAEVVAIPETAVEDGGQLGCELVYEFLSIASLPDSEESLFIALHDSLDIVGTAAAAFDF